MWVIIFIYFSWIHAGAIEMAEDEDPRKKTIFGMQRSTRQDEDSSDDDY